MFLIPVSGSLTELGFKCTLNGPNSYENHIKFDRKAVIIPKSLEQLNIAFEPPEQRTSYEPGLSLSWWSSNVMQAARGAPDLKYHGILRQTR